MGENKRMARRKEGLLWECLHSGHVGNRMCPRGVFARNGRGERDRHSWCRECRREGKSAQAAKRRGAGVRAIPAGWIHILWVRQRGLCAECGRALGYDYHVDHRMPVSRGGMHELANLRLLHKRCNLRKGARLTHR
jgi:5-methylcytosine-specific restriction endonuclease McrA